MQQILVSERPDATKDVPADRALRKSSERNENQGMGRDGVCSYKMLASVRYHSQVNV